MKNFKSLCLFTIGILISINANAGGGNAVEKWFDDMNYSNVTSPGVYEGQSARYMTLGGISTRAPITQPFKFIDIQTPKYSAGCAGIDLYAGGFSSIDSDQFIENLRAIGQNAKSLAFMMGIQLVCPQCSGVMERVQNWANKFNSMNMDSCEAASQLIQGGLKLAKYEHYDCITARREKGDDFATAFQKCGTGGASKDEGKNKIAFTQGNLAWFVLMNDPYFRADVDFAEIVMNITGTIIINKTDKNDSSSGYRPTDISPALTEKVQKERFKNIYTALMRGSNAANGLLIYKCQNKVANPDACTEISPTPEAASNSFEGLYDKVDKLMIEIGESIQNDSVISQQAKGLIASSRIPIYRYLSALTTQTTKSEHIKSHVAQFTQIVADDILYNALSAVIQRVENGSETLPKGISDTPRVKNYTKDLNIVMDGIGNLSKENKDKGIQLLEIQKRINEYERLVLKDMDRDIVTSTMYGKGL